jgi:Flp pilus assembly pilin Flp
MESLVRTFIRYREITVQRLRGQTMTEYALVLGAVAVAVYGAYKVLGNSVSSLASGVDSVLTNA